MTKARRSRLSSAGAESYEMLARGSGRGSHERSVARRDVRRRRNSSKLLAGCADHGASFEEEHLKFLQRVQRFLHRLSDHRSLRRAGARPPARGGVNSSHFVTGSNLSTVLTQVTIIGILGIGADAGDPDRRHRSLGRRHHGDFVGRDGTARRSIDGVPIILAFPLGLLCGVGLRLSQRRAGHAA